MSRPSIHLLIIDPQRDFCDPSGSLFVPGADEDMNRLAKFVHDVTSQVDDIHTTLDSHQPLHIAHPERWVGKDGKHPRPVETVIEEQDIINGTWRASNPKLQGLQLAYTRALKANGRYQLRIWPPHCEISSPGATVVPNLLAALRNWCVSRSGTIDYVPKGSHPHTEHYSAVMADVPDPADPTTQLNTRLIRALEDADQIWLAGEASSHCVANTGADIIENFSDPSMASKFVVIEDCMSAVPTCEFLYDAFKTKYGARLRFATTTELRKEIR